MKKIAYKHLYQTLFKLENREVVKFQTRWLKKRYKRNQEYRYKRYSLDFPTSLNEKIEPLMHKNFSVDFIIKDTVDKEVINITLMRDKLAEQKITELAKVK